MVDAEVVARHLNDLIDLDRVANFVNDRLDDLREIAQHINQAAMGEE